mgnify:CR=1 FL=1
MEIIGIVTEYNPFHNGHLYQIKKTRELYPDSIIVICLNGYFLERGEISIETKEEKTRLALKYGANIVVELPFVFGSNSADIFAEASVKILNNLHITKLLFGSELNDISLLTSLAKKQLNKSFDKESQKDVKTTKATGGKRPWALEVSNGDEVFTGRHPSDEEASTGGNGKYTSKREVKYQPSKQGSGSTSKFSVKRTGNVITKEY